MGERLAVLDRLSARLLVGEPEGGALRVPLCVGGGEGARLGAPVWPPVPVVVGGAEVAAGEGDSVCDELPEPVCMGEAAPVPLPVPLCEEEGTGVPDLLPGPDCVGLAVTVLETLMAPLGEDVLPLLGEGVLVLALVALGAQLLVPLLVPVLIPVPVLVSLLLPLPVPVPLPVFVPLPLPLLEGDGVLQAVGVRLGVPEGLPVAGGDTPAGRGTSLPMPMV